MIVAAAWVAIGIVTGLVMGRRGFSACAVSGYGLIAVGRRGGGATKALLGSTADALARRAEVPVLIV